MKTVRAVLHQMALDAWSAAAVVLTLSLVLETLERGFVSRHFNVVILALLVLAATFAVLATHPGVPASDPSHRPARNADALLALASALAAVAAWFLLPRELSLVWRVAAAGITFAAALTVRAAFDKNG